MVIQGRTTDGKYIEVKVGDDGSLAVGAELTDLLSPGTPVASTAAEKSKRISAGACTLLQVVATNLDTENDYWLLLFDSSSASVPSDSTVARESYPVPAGGTGGPPMFLQGSAFSNGLWAVLSTTAGTLAIVSSSVGLFKAEIRT